MHILYAPISIISISTSVRQMTMAATATMMLILIILILSIDYYIYRVYHTPLCIVRQHPALFCKEE